MICGRYEGVDERVAKYLADEEISIGEYVLTGGEIPAMVVVDSIARLMPGVLGNVESPKDESFSKKNYLEHPQYTKPAEFQGWKVPEVLLAGIIRRLKSGGENKVKCKKSSYEKKPKTGPNSHHHHFCSHRLWPGDDFFGGSGDFPAAFWRRLLFFQAPAFLRRSAGTCSDVYGPEDRLSFLEKIRFFLFALNLVFLVLVFIPGLG